MKITIHDGEHWITAHPHGREEKGTPLLIEGSNGHYVVKGGAGGKLDGKVVNPKTMSRGKEGGGTESGNETPTEQPKTPEVKQPVAQPKESPVEQPKEEPKAEPLSSEQHFENLRKIGEQEAKAGYEGELNDNPAIEAYAQKHDLKGYQLVNGFNEFKQEFEKHAPKKEVKYEQQTKNPEAGTYQQKTHGEGYYAQTTIEYKVNGKLNNQNFYQREIDKGAGDTFIAFLNEHAHQLTERLSTMQANSPRAAEFEYDLKEQLYQQIQRNGDPSLPQDSETQAKAIKNARALEEQLRNQKKAERLAKGASLREAYQKFREPLDKQLAEQAKVTKREPYKPAKTSKEAADWAIKNNLADHVNYGKLTPEIANASNECLSRHLAEFPALRAGQKFTGSCQESNKDAHAHSKHRTAIQLAETGWGDKEIEAYIEKSKASRTPNCWAWADPRQGIGFNEAWGKAADTAKLEASLKRSLDTQWHPIGCDTIKSVFDHEYGHQMDYLLGLSRNTEVAALRRESARMLGGTKESLSQYATKNIAEFIAEAWTESINNPNPRPIAKRLAEIVRSEYAKKFG